MKNFFRIMKKELFRVFKDPRMIIVLILPGVMIFALYSFMGNVFNSNQTDEEKAMADTYIVYTVNMPEELKENVVALNYKFDYTEKSTADINDETKALLKTGDVDLILVFCDNFAENIGKIEKPKAEIYYNPYESKSNYAKNVIDSAITMFRLEQIKVIHGVIDIELFKTEDKLTFDDKKAVSGVIAVLLPMILLAFLFSGCMAVTPESIAGEKERGTMATLLATPVKRSEIALGKISALSILALVSAVSSFLGLIFSLPSLLGIKVSIFSIYGFTDMLLLFLIIVSAVLIIVGMMSLLSAFSKSVKEATLYATPFMILSMVVGLLVAFTGVPSSFFYYLIPLFNTAASIASVLSSGLNVLNLTVTIISNAVYVALFIYLMTRIFKSEKIMFSK